MNKVLDLSSGEIPSLADSPNQKIERVSFLTKLCYCIPAMVFSAMAINITIHAPRFYSDIVLAPLGYIAIAIAIARAFDAITDPTMGWISDRVKTPWGRRKPWIIFAAPFCAISFWALFSPPGNMGPNASSLWFGLAFGAYFLFYTILHVPYTALGAEISPDYNERSSLFGMQSFFTVLGLLIGSIVPNTLQSGFGLDPRSAYNTLGLIYGCLMIVFGLFLFKVKEKAEFVSRESNPLVAGVRRAFRNKPFCILVIVGIMSFVPSAITGVVMPYYVHYVIRPENPEKWLMIYLLTYFGIGFLALPIWVAISKRFGKLKTFVIHSVIIISGNLLLFLGAPGRETMIFWVIFYIGIVSATFYFLFPAMMADVIDYDELRTGKRREGQFGSFIALIPKLAIIPAASVPIALLSMAGYIPNQEQTPLVINTIKLLYGILPAVFSFCGLVIMLRYPISQEVHETIRQGIGKHENGESAKDPITNCSIPPIDHHSENETTSWLLDHFSHRELNNYTMFGLKRLLVNIAVKIAALAIVLTAATVIAIQSISVSDKEPGLLCLLSIVTAGFAFTFLLFHALKVRPALQMAAGGFPQEAIDEQLQKGNSNKVKVPAF